MGLKNGERIFGNWQSGSIWYPGVIIKADESKNVYFVHYDDGDEEEIRSRIRIQKDIAAKKYVDIEKMKKGHRILGNWNKGGHWYSGIVKEIDIKDKKVSVTYDDGDSEWISDFKLIQRDKTKKKIKLEDLSTSMRVVGNWKASGTWYNGKIDKIDDGKIHITYDDGDEEWVSDLKLIQKDK